MLGGQFLIAPEKKCLAIVRIINGIQQPQIHFQAVCDPAKVSANFIRFEGPGSDLHGWFNLDDLILVRIVAYPHSEHPESPEGSDMWVSA